MGIGTALNAAHYPAAVTEVIGVDTNRGMERIARRRIARARVPIELRYTDGGRLPFEDGAFDTVVATWTLCSVGPVAELLADLRRVVKPEEIGRAHV